MTEQQLKEALAYANDPSTDRTFMAMKMLELLLKISGDKYFSEELLGNLIHKAFFMSDEFLKLGRKTESGAG